MGACVSTTLRKKYKNTLKYITEHEKSPGWVKDLSIRSLAASERRLNETLLAEYKMSLTAAERKLTELNKTRTELFEEERKWVRTQRTNFPNTWTDDLARRAENEWKTGFLRAYKRNAKDIKSWESAKLRAETGIANSEEKIDMCIRISSKIGTVLDESESEFLAKAVNDNYQMQDWATTTNTPGSEFNKLSQTMQYGAPAEQTSISGDAALVAMLIKGLTESTRTGGESSSSSSGAAVINTEDPEDEILYDPGRGRGARSALLNESSSY